MNIHPMNYEVELTSKPNWVDADFGKVACESKSVNCVIFVEIGSAKPRKLEFSVGIKTDAKFLLTVAGTGLF